MGSDVVQVRLDNLVSFSFTFQLTPDVYQHTCLQGVSKNNYVRYKQLVQRSNPVPPLYPTLQQRT
jgi:hypothetical protein